MAKKFELTSETTIRFGRTLYRIRALVDFSTVKKGDLGGFVEKEENLSQVSGNAWVYGNAQVSGNAWVYGNAQVSGNARVYGNAQVSGDAWVSGNAQVSPVNVIGLRWPITITDTHIIIGCEYHSISEWNNFKDARIKLMSSEALAWWNSNKDWIIKLAKEHEAKAKSVGSKAA